MFIRIHICESYVTVCISVKIYRNCINIVYNYQPRTQILILLLLWTFKMLRYIFFSRNHLECFHFIVINAMNLHFLQFVWKPPKPLNALTHRTINAIKTVQNCKFPGAFSRSRLMETKLPLIRSPRTDGNLYSLLVWAGKIDTCSISLNRMTFCTITRPSTIRCES